MIVPPNPVPNPTRVVGWLLSLLEVYWWSVRWLRCTTCTAAVMVPQT
ncbi:hypothetical protein [Mycobacteroides franklinii]